MHWWIAISIVGSSFFGTSIVESFVIQPTRLFFPLPQQQHHQQHAYHQHGGRITALSAATQVITNIVDEDIVTTKTKQRRTWEESYQLLVSYKEKNGNCNVPYKYEDDSRLGWWVVDQRRRKETLTDERIAKLGDLGFSWSISRTWEESYQLLVSYKEKYGNCNVPQKYKNDSHLGRWVMNQRKGKANLSDERIAQLDSLGFTWSIWDEQWDEMFEKLKEYKTKHGNCNVPQKFRDDRSLGMWVNAQRHQKEKGSLSDERIAKLDAVGLSWSVFGEKWDEMFEKLKEYKAKHGNCNVPIKYKDDPRLGWWVNNQRIRKDKLSDERITKLDDIGFLWNKKTTNIGGQLRSVD